jgi:hypothetical protein
MEMDADHQPASVDEALREISGCLFSEFEVGMSRRGRTPDAEQGAVMGFQILTLKGEERRGGERMKQKASVN